MNGEHLHVAWTRPEADDALCRLRRGGENATRNVDSICTNGQLDYPDNLHVPDGVAALKWKGNGNSTYRYWTFESKTVTFLVECP
jgi:hypothetical protein